MVENPGNLKLYIFNLGSFWNAEERIANRRDCWNYNPASWWDITRWAKNKMDEEMDDDDDDDEDNNDDERY